MGSFEFSHSDPSMKCFDRELILYNLFRSPGFLQKMESQRLQSPAFSTNTRGYLLSHKSHACAMCQVGTTNVNARFMYQQKSEGRQLNSQANRKNAQKLVCTLRDALDA